MPFGGVLQKSSFSWLLEGKTRAIPWTVALWCCL